MVPFIALLAGGVYGGIHHDTEAQDQLGRQIPHKLLAGIVVQFGGQGHQPLAGHSAVLAGLGGFGCVPEAVPVVCPFRGIDRSRDERRADARTPGIVEDLARAFVAQSGASPISGGCDRATARASADGLHVEMKDCHGGASSGGIGGLST